MSAQPAHTLYIGLMSGTSLDGVDGLLASIPQDSRSGQITTLASAYIPFSEGLRSDLMALQASSTDEIHREALAANAMARHYAQCVMQLLERANIDSSAVRAIGVHGQTIRHRPECGYTRQVNNAALLAELTGIDVIADFRSRDIAAGGQGAPLVPAFHQAVFRDAERCRVVVNIGGISNITILPSSEEQPVLGFDTGPGNALMDGWIKQHKDLSYDANGEWAQDGSLLPDLLYALLDEPFFQAAPPKSTGRDLFHYEWLSAKLAAFPQARPVDVQTTLTELTAVTIAEAIRRHAPDAQSVHVCGGGAYNGYLMQRLNNALAERRVAAEVDATDALGVPANHVEALAFAWLASRFMERKAGNLPSATGAKGERILGALYPA